MKKLCKYCQTEFDARRKNHMYCTSSCKTMASYKRNGYKYVSGHYKKEDKVNNDELTVKEQEKNELIKPQNEKKDLVTKEGVVSAGLGNLAADGITYGFKKIFAPSALSATKGDINSLKLEIQKLYALLNNK